MQNTLRTARPVPGLGTARRVAVLLTATVIAFEATGPFNDSKFGPFIYWLDLTFVGIPWAALGAWVVGEGLRGRPGWRSLVRLPMALVLGVGIVWLVHREYDSFAPWLYGELGSAWSYEAVELTVGTVVVALPQLIPLPADPAPGPGARRRDPACRRGGAPSRAGRC